MAKKPKVQTDEMRLRLHAKEYVAWQRARDREERNFNRGFDLAFRARKKGRPMF